MSSFAAKKLLEEGDDDDDDVKTCRICLENESSDDADDHLVSPCNCSGSQKFVHLQCLSRWQATVLFQETSATPNERRHLTCNTCGANFHGLSIPTRKKLLESVCGTDVISNLRGGSFLVATRLNSERTVNNNFPALIAALFKLKRAHWQYSVYFVIAYGNSERDDAEGETKVYGLNLTRPMDGTTDHPVPDEVLLKQQELQQKAEESASISASDNDVKSSQFPSIKIQHHNGGPVKWSSCRTAMCVVPLSSDRLREVLRQRGFISEAEVAADDIVDSEPVFLSSFLLMQLSSLSTLVVGKFAIVVELLQSILHLYSDGADVSIFSYSGFAEWTTAQLLREVARGSWGVVGPQCALGAIKELISPTVIEYPSMEDLISAPQVASLTVNESCSAGEDERTDNTESKNVPMHAGTNMNPTERKCDQNYEDETTSSKPPAVRVSSYDPVTRARAASNPAGVAGKYMQPTSNCAQSHGFSDQGHDESNFETRIDTNGQDKSHEQNDEMYPSELEEFDYDLPGCRPPSLRMPSSSSVSRARAASSTAASVGVIAHPHTFSLNRDKVEWSNDHLDDISQNNIWERMMELSLESGENVLRQQFSR